MVKFEIRFCGFGLRKNVRKKIRNCPGNQTILGYSRGKSW